ncbi:hypothetical protein EYF80_003448 [Liparis tanakae]|uniref:Uncharacterized protein n=1 Tax=Liparis tanakae TaxID=230148 RepID=A0A4Z2J9K0_9TELE|nr:hypothetical protein EYF80_003448 [Liparis tanakae]
MEDWMDGEMAGSEERSREVHRANSQHELHLEYKKCSLEAGPPEDFDVGLERLMEPENPWQRGGGAVLTPKLLHDLVRSVEQIQDLRPREVSVADPGPETS